jgi:hypothetical protein
VYVSSVFLHSSPLPQFLPILTIFRPTVLTIIHSLAAIDAQFQDLPAHRSFGGFLFRLNARGKNSIVLVTPEHVVPQIIEALPLVIEAGLRVPLV